MLPGTLLWHTAANAVATTGDETEASAAGSAEAQDPGSPAVALSPADEAFKSAFAEAERKNAFEFLALSAHVPRDYLLADYLDYWQLRQRLYAAENLAAPDLSLDQAVRTFIDTSRNMLTGDLLRRQWMLELGRRGDWVEFELRYPEWVRRNDTRVYCRAGQAHLALGRPVGEEAMNAFVRDRDLGEECGALAHDLRAHGLVNDDDLRQRMWRALEVRDWASVRLLAGMLNVDEVRVELALTKYQSYLAGIDASGGIPDAAGRDVLLLALVSLSRPKPVEAAAQMDRLGKWLGLAEQRFVWSQIAASSMRDMIPQAYEYALLAEDAPMTDTTREWLARAAMRQHDWALLTRLIADMSSDNQADPVWVYWRARALEASGARFGAHALLRKIAHRHDYYGRLAAEELGELVSLPASSGVANPGDIASAAMLPGFARAERFFALGMRYRGNREWSFALTGMSDRQLIAAAHLACSRDLLERCIHTASRTREQHDYALRFISPFRDRLAPVAAENGINLAWMYGLIHQESRFLTDARSSVGARGLMQIMPATGKWIAGKKGVRGFRTAQLTEFDTNVRFGSFYLRTVYDDLHASPLLASAAYNAGPRRARQWAATLLRDVDGPLFVEIIPFNETRDYVKKVLLNTAYYASVFEGRPQSLKRLLGHVSLEPFRSSDIP